MTEVYSGGGGSGLTSISTQSTTGSAAAVTFSSIPGSYSHLLLVCMARSNVNGTNENMLCQFNADTGNNYVSQKAFTHSTTAGAQDNATPTSSMWIGDINGSGTDPANSASGYAIFIPGYAQTTFTKTLVTMGGQVLAFSTTNVYTEAVYGFWNSTSAITSIKLLPATSTFTNGSLFSLYGLI